MPAAHDFDLFVIGGGSGGVRAARIAAGYGARVAVAEEYRIGGTCVIRGCIPKKLLVYASRFPDDFEDSVGFGWKPGKARFDWKRLIASKDAEIDRLNAAYTRTLENAGVTIIRSRAEIEHPHRIRLTAEDRVVTADTILIAAGAVPYIDPDLEGAEHVITSNEMFHLRRQPKKLVIAGGGFVAVEFACIMRGLGTEVTMICRGEILRGFDDETRGMLHASLEKRGIEVICNDTIRRVEKVRGGVVGHSRSGRTLSADQILQATGRRPHTTGLGVETAGVKCDANGAVVVDRYSRTNVKNIYAIGDVTNRLQLTPVAIREGHAFADTVFGGKKTAVDHAGVPRAVFGTPELGTVGLTEEEAKDRHAAVDIYRAVFRPLKSTLSGRDEKMMMKLIVDAETDRVLGCHILGLDAGEMVQLVAIAMRLKAKKADFDATMALHPSAAEELVTMRTPSERWRRGKTAAIPPPPETPVEGVEV
jgi:glutathione reductase (NADPH)